MADNREIVKIELSTMDKMKIALQIGEQMGKLGLGSDYESLNLGIELPPDWPMDKDDHPTMAQLVVLAQKLKMKIVISNIDLFPLKDGNAG